MVQLQALFKKSDLLVYRLLLATGQTQYIIYIHVYTIYTRTMNGDDVALGLSCDQCRRSAPTGFTLLSRSARSNKIYIEIKTFYKSVLDKNQRKTPGTTDHAEKECNF